MASTLDFSKFTFTAEQIRAVNELIFDEVVQSPELDLLCTVYPGIVYDKEIGFIGDGGLVGIKSQGCNPTPQQWNIATRKVLWQPQAWEILLEECWKDIDSTAAVYALKTGREVADFTDTDYMAIVIEKLTQAIKEFIVRLVWFNNKDAKNIADGGTITAGIDISFFNILDGFWKQLQAQLTANPAQRVTIAENAGTTYTAQELNPANMQGYLQKLVYGADIVLRSSPNGFIACTQSFYDAYAMSLQNVQLESMYANLVNGQKTLTFNGIPLYAMPIWDKMIAQFENTGTKLTNPHRALYTTKDALGVSMDGLDSFEKIETWYNKDTRTVKTEAMGKTDAKLLNPAMFQLAI
jgi:hypothetical protein